MRPRRSLDGRLDVNNDGSASFSAYRAMHICTYTHTYTHAYTHTHARDRLDGRTDRQTDGKRTSNMYGYRSLRHAACMCQTCTQIHIFRGAGEPPTIRMKTQPGMARRDAFPEIYAGSGILHEGGRAGEEGRVPKCGETGRKAQHVSR